MRCECLYIDFPLFLFGSKRSKRSEMELRQMRCECLYIDFPLFLFGSKRSKRSEMELRQMRCGVPLY